MTKIYRAIQGDAFDAIAYRQWQDCGLVHKLLQANVPYMDVLVFGAGIELNLPEIAQQKKIGTLPPWYRVKND